MSLYLIWPLITDEIVSINALITGSFSWLFEYIMLISLAGAGSSNGMIFWIFFEDKLFECRYGIIVIHGPLLDKLIKVSKLPLFSSYCLFKSSKVQRFNTWFLKQWPSWSINKSLLDKSPRSRDLLPERKWCSGTYATKGS